MKKITKQLARSFYIPRPKDGHKGFFGHALLMLGSRGKMGAAVLAARACMRSGVGKVSVFAPKCGYSVLQTAVPEVMVIDSEHEDYLSGDVSFRVYMATGIGCGIGQHPQTAKLLHHVLTSRQVALVLDADALNLLAENKSWLKKLPEFSILTPHPKEFQRLFGGTGDRQEAIAIQQQKAKELDCTIILKGDETVIATPTDTYINTTGNSGMGTAGTGDVLTGLLTGLLAQGYCPEEAAVVGVYLHGLAGDLAAAAGSEEGLIATDLIEHLPLAFRKTFYNK